MLQQIKTRVRDASYFIGNAVLPSDIRNSGPLGSLRRQVIFWSRESFVMSYPKCGRTWLRTMIGRVVELHHGLSIRNPMEVQHFWKLSAGIPCIAFSHDDGPNLKPASAIETDKSRYAAKNILFLTRDPRDVLVSYYFDAKNRMNVFDGTLSDFVYQDIGSIDSIIKFYNIWANNRSRVKSFQLLSYEEMHQDPKAALRTAIEFLGIRGVPDDVIDNAIEFGSFSNLRKIEAANAFDHERMRPRDHANPESFKVRRGKISGYKDYLAPAEIEYIDAKIRDHLDPFYANYRTAGAQAVSA